MSENEKAEIIRNAPLRDYDPDTELVTHVKSETPGEKNGIIFPIPTDDESCQARYNCNMGYVNRCGIRNFSHHVPYSGTHEEMQAQADAYRVRTPGEPRTLKGRKTIKKVEDERDAALAVAHRLGEENGMSEEQILAMVEEYNAVPTLSTE